MPSPIASACGARLGDGLPHDVVDVPLREACVERPAEFDEAIRLAGEGAYLATNMFYVARRTGVLVRHRERVDAGGHREQRVAHLVRESRHHDALGLESGRLAPSRALFVQQPDDHPHAEDTDDRELELGQADQGCEVLGEVGTLAQTRAEVEGSLQAERQKPQHDQDAAETAAPAVAAK